MKTEERTRARELRTQGWSISEIEKEVGVARSSVGRWVADVALNESHRARLAARVTQGRLDAADRKRTQARAVRQSYQTAGRDRARRGDASYVAGCMLYWAEGEKSRNAVALANSDPALVAVFAEFLRTHFEVADNAMTVYCNLFADHAERRRSVEEFWLSTLKLPPSSLRASTVNVRSRASTGKRTNTLPYGTCKLVVCSTRIVQTIFGSIQEYAGVDRPDWID